MSTRGSRTADRSRVRRPRHHSTTTGLISATTTFAALGTATEQRAQREAHAEATDEHAVCGPLELGDREPRQLFFRAAREAVHQHAAGDHHQPVPSPRRRSSSGPSVFDGRQRLPRNGHDASSLGSPRSCGTGPRVLIMMDVLDEGERGSRPRVSSPLPARLCGGGVCFQPPRGSRCRISLPPGACTPCPDRIFVSVDESTGRSTISFAPAEAGGPIQHEGDSTGAVAMREAKTICERAILE